MLGFWPHPGARVPGPGRRPAARCRGSVPGPEEVSTLVELLLVVGMAAAYLLVAVLVFHSNAFKDGETDRINRGLLAFAPALFVVKRVADRSLGPDRDRRDDQCA